MKPFTANPLKLVTPFYDGSHVASFPSQLYPFGRLGQQSQKRSFAVLLLCVTWFHFYFSMLYSSGFGNQPGSPVLGTCVEAGLHGREHGAG